MTTERHQNRPPEPLRAHRFTPPPYVQQHSPHDRARASTVWSMETMPSPALTVRYLTISLPGRSPFSHPQSTNTNPVFPLASDTQVLRASEKIRDHLIDGVCNEDPPGRTPQRATGIPAGVLCPLLGISSFLIDAFVGVEFQSNKATGRNAGATPPSFFAQMRPHPPQEGTKGAQVIMSAFKMFLMITFKSQLQ